MYNYLNKINTPQDVKNLKGDELVNLCEEIREFLIDSVSKTGGHLSSNLGTIELTIAMHSIYCTPKDKFVFDVGHQCYTHKIITGRKEKFDKLRMLNGLSGFPSPKESEHDAFISGHGNTAISAAIGMASAKKIQGDSGKVIAVVGDGAFTGGMVYEGMNNVHDLSNLIVILNDNKMSISKNVGSVAQYLTHLRTNPTYFKFKRNLQILLDSIPLIGTALRKYLQSVKATLRQKLYHSTMFENMGFQYVGPIDGHNVKELCTLLKAYKTEQSAPLFIHVQTTKGKGFTPAEQNPGEFHGVSAFDVNDIQDPDFSDVDSYSSVFGKELAELASSDNKICAITAAMKYGTGLQYFYRQHKQRFFDVGMAEQHAVTFAAGLAASKFKPVVCIYSTFLQRSYDQIIHDINLQKLNVLLAIDRAGFVPGDGETHQGVYDCAFLSQISNMSVYSPCNYDELKYWLKKLINEQNPRAIRYPRGAQNEQLAKLGVTGNLYDVYKGENNNVQTAIITYGGQTLEVLNAVSIAQKKDKHAHIYKLMRVHPLPEGLVNDLLKYEKIIFAEEGITSGGIGEHVLSKLISEGYKGEYKHVGVNSNNLTHASIPQLKQLYKLDEKSLQELI